MVPVFDLDVLYCKDETFEVDGVGEDFGSDEDVRGAKGSFPLFPENGGVVLDWDGDEIAALFDKEERESLLGGHIGGLSSNGSLMGSRKSAIEWMMRVIRHYGFSVLTTVLAVNYFDRYISRVCFQRDDDDKPWMSQLIAVACLSLAAKVEETQVPLLLDLQVEESKYIFEAKTIQKMELLVLSALEWKMNPVTPLSFVDYTVRRLGLKARLGLKFLWRCEQVLLSAITDPRFGTYLPSALAAGTMLHVLKELDPDNVLGRELTNILKLSRDKVNDCCKFILDIQCQTRKRNYSSTPSSPNGVIDAYFSCDSSNDSWGLAPSVSSSPEPPFKKSRSHDQQMRLAPVRHL